MEHSTQVTKELCGAMVSDMMSIILDGECGKKIKGVSEFNGDDIFVPPESVKTPIIRETAPIPSADGGDDTTTASTPVVAPRQIIPGVTESRKCKAHLEVENSGLDTGRYELIYKAKAAIGRPMGGQTFSVDGKSMMKKGYVPVGSGAGNESGGAAALRKSTGSLGSIMQLNVENASRR
eukprot:GFYU01001378.1.p1 GENE.GFYU01001378.1~~GFYU01001378.1.p1  ORF type:complete len:209 (+),score=69.95 GFYU01001378.1:92-628(+)